MSPTEYVFERLSCLGEAKCSVFLLILLGFSLDCMLVLIFSCWDLPYSDPALTNLF